MGGGYFITGTDTAVGKTRVSVAVLHALRARGLRAVGMKPVASGCLLTPMGWRNDDALALQAASEPSPSYDEVNPFALPAATAPQIAAAAVGVVVTMAPILAAHARLNALADAVVVEGVGGWLAPLADGLDQSELASALGLPVLLVVGLKLGCLNHARLSERAIRDDGLRLAGWIANAAEPAMDFADDYFELLQRELHAPCLGRLPYAPTATGTDFATRLRLPG